MGGQPPVGVMVRARASQTVPRRAAGVIMIDRVQTCSVCKHHHVGTWHRLLPEPLTALRAENIRLL